MALRVLLADESSTIKKVMQLALQDFGVEVKAVPIGLDVLQVARSFNPDIVFADVLLAKKNGYEVSAELKADPTLKKTPVILMWSGFMELDENKAQTSKADQRLEKPFDAETLRALVKELVPSLGSNLIANFLSFPEMPEMVEDGKRSPAEEPVGVQLTDLRVPKAPPARPAPKIPTPEPEQDPSAWEEIEEPEEFQAVPLPKNQGLPQTKAPASAPNDDWSRQDLSRYKIEIPKDDAFSFTDEDLTNTSIALSSGAEEISLDEIDNPEPRPQAKKTPAKTPPISKTFTTPSQMSASATSLSALDPMRAEEVLRQEARAVLENVAWKLLPEIVERVVREELQKLLKDAERL
ncbi:MAG: response regulator [Pseudobdellovibrionaceae bacterium]